MLLIVSLLNKIQLEFFLLSAKPEIYCEYFLGILVYDTIWFHIWYIASIVSCHIFTLLICYYYSLWCLWNSDHSILGAELWPNICIVWFGEMPNKWIEFYTHRVHASLWFLRSAFHNLHTKLYDESIRSKNKNYSPV